MDRNVQQYVDSQMAKLADRAFGRVQMLHQGILESERKFHGAWNLFSVLVRVLENVGKEQGWWRTREEFMGYFERAKEELNAETMKAIEEAKASKTPTEKRDLDKMVDALTPDAEGLEPVSELVKEKN